MSNRIQILQKRQTVIRLGIIGCGGMSAGWGAGALAMSDRVEIAAIVDIAPERTVETAKLFPRARVATDYREVMDDIDAALLILPHHLHHPVAMDCLRAKRHVIVEKPMANSETECLEMIQAAKANNLRLMVGYPLRYHPLFLKLKSLIDSRHFGDLFQFSLWTEQMTRYPADHWVSSAEKLGGGQLFSHGCHYIDLMLWFLGEPIEGTHVGTNYGTPWMEREGTSNVCIRFKSGALGYHMGTWGAAGTRHGYAFHAHCTGAMLEADFLAGKIFLHAPNAKELAEVSLPEGTATLLAQNLALLYEMPVGKMVQYELKHFLDCVDEERTPVTDGDDSLAGLRVIWRLYESERKGVVADLRGLLLRNREYRNLLG